MQSTTKKATAALLATAWFALSLYILPYYTNGDQIAYRLVYEIAKNLSFSDGFNTYTAVLGSKEPGYFILAYTFSPIIQKDWLIATANGILGYLLIASLLKRNASIIVALTLLPNFYIMVLLFSAERLKFGAILFFLAVISENKKRIISAILAVLTHTQFMLLAASLLLSKTAQQGIEEKNKNTLKKYTNHILAIATATITVFLLKDHIQGKLNFYSSANSGASLENLIKPIVFLLLTLFYAKKEKTQAALMHAPIIAASLVVGEDRIVIFSYFIFMLYSLKTNKGINIGVLATSFYFGVKGFLFLGNIINYGNGFHGQ
ncbi:hypothetical protein [Pseudomonas sp. AN-1]|uniref:hypothetical protein n=1 Tax=Pseudomonas sp. AN-1 TaxID=3096605 RepID=UPI002A6A5963|nr:hypothetical protein [Pseudomonas sp. AN-1]WPP47391.1 hypothetical protein SK095_08460 [Pseudomonas sp. AN-1]